MAHQFRIYPKPPCDFGLTASLFARFSSEIVDQYQDGVYRRVLHLGGKPVLISVWAEAASEPSLSVGFEVEGVSDADQKTVEVWIRHSFGLDFPLDEFYATARDDPVMAPLTKRYTGLRMLARPCLFEALVMAITTQQINLPFAYTLKARLVRAFGHKVTYEGREYFAFPTAEVLATASVADLRAMQYSERKAAYIIDLAHLVASGSLDLDALSALEEEAFIQELTKVRGLGRWSAEWALCRGLGRPDAIAADDLGVQRAFSRYCFGGQRVTAPQVREKAEAWRPYRSYAVHYLLMALYHRLEPWAAAQG